MIGEALRLIRVFHDMKQAQLADELQLSKSYLSEIESQNKEPTLAVINKYAEYFDLPASSILFFSEKLDSKELDAKPTGNIPKLILSILKFIADRSGRK
jgi:transcriptional regulator with XRE-family HTH domain